MTELSTGPVEFLAFSFPLDADDSLIGLALRELIDSDQLDVVDLVVGERRGDEGVEYFEFAEAGRGFGLGEFEPRRSLIAVEDLDAVSGSIGPDTRIVVLVVEHLWHRLAVSQAVGLGGQLVVDEWVEPEDYAAALAADDRDLREA